MDRCEELGAAYGVPPQQVLRWPWIEVEEIWQSYERRQRRKMKYDQAIAELAGAAARLGGMLAEATGDGRKRYVPDPKTGDLPDSALEDLFRSETGLEVVGSNISVVRQ